jgi:release factor glutamine methyltransferase
MMKVVQALEQAAEKLTQAKIPSPVADSYWLLAHAIGSSRAEVVRRVTFDENLSESEFENLETALARRVGREPLQHITGKAAFRSLELSVGPGVFIPRFETEQVAQIGIDFLNSLTASAKAVDLGSGSGAIALSLAQETAAEIYAIEISDEAARYAMRNISQLGLRVELMVGSFEDLLPKLSPLDLVVSNPPYIPISATPIESEVANYDPEIALYSGVDGLDAAREIIAISKFALKPYGMLLLEHADGQGDQLRELLLGEGFNTVIAHPDLTGRLRAVSGTRGS